MGDIAACFNPKNHPEVISGRRLEQDIINDFYNTLSLVTVTGYLSREQFLAYYKDISAGEIDNEFESSMKAIWIDSKKNAVQPMRSLASISNNSDTHVLVFDKLKKVLKGRGILGIIAAID